MVKKMYKLSGAVYTWKWPTFLLWIWIVYILSASCLMANHRLVVSYDSAMFVHYLRKKMCNKYIQIDKKRLKMRKCLVIIVRRSCDAIFNHTGTVRSSGGNRPIFLSKPFRKNRPATVWFMTTQGKIIENRPEAVRLWNSAILQKSFNRTAPVLYVTIALVVAGYWIGFGTVPVYKLQVSYICK